MIHALCTSLEIPAERQEVFSFFARPENLERITPKGLSFRIITHLPLEVSEGAIIDYRLSLFAVPFRWKTLISRWDPPKVFVDEQIEGPYAFWRHTHRFYDTKNGTRMEDEVLYRLPFFPFGEAVYPVVALQLKNIFDFRREAILSIFRIQGK